MIRCGYRAYGSGLLVEDTSFNTYTTNAIKNNIDVGVYFYSQALNKEEAIEEANYVLTLVKPYNITYPIAIDVEAIENDSFRQENLSASELTDVIIAFCDTIKAAGYTPLIYSNLCILWIMLNLKDLKVMINGSPVIRLPLHIIPTNTLCGSILAQVQ